MREQLGSEQLSSVIQALEELEKLALIDSQVVCEWVGPAAELDPSFSSFSPQLQGLVHRNLIALWAMGWFRSQGRPMSTDLTIQGTAANPIEVLPSQRLSWVSSLELKGYTGSSIDGLAGFTSLRNLALSAEHLTALPRDIDKLEQLQHLKLDCPALTTLPSTFGFLDNLRELTIAASRIQQFPSALLQCQRLEELQSDPLCSQPFRILSACFPS